MNVERGNLLAVTENCAYFEQAFQGAAEGTDPV